MLANELWKQVASLQIKHQKASTSARCVSFEKVRRVPGKIFRLYIFIVWTRNWEQIQSVTQNVGVYFRTEVYLN